MKNYNTKDIFINPKFINSELFTKPNETIKLGTGIISAFSPSLVTVIKERSSTAKYDLFM